MVVDRIDEEFLLFALHPDGRWVSHREASVDRGVAAAWLAELVVDGKLRIQGDHIVPKGRSPMDDETLDWVLDKIRSSKRPRKARHWVRKLGKKAGPHIGAVMDRLRMRGYVDRVVHGGMRQKIRYPQHTPGARKELRDHLLEVLYARRPSDPPTLGLLAVMDSSGLMGHVFGPHRAKELHDRLLWLMSRDHRFRVIAEAARRR